MEGYIRKRGNRYYYSFEVAGIGGKRRRIERAGGLTKKESEAALREALTQYRNTGSSFEPIKQNNVTDETKFRGALSKELDKKKFQGLEWSKENGEFVWIVDEKLFNEQILNDINREFLNTYSKGCKDFIYYFKTFFLLKKDKLSVFDILENEKGKAHRADFEATQKEKSSASPNGNENIQIA